METKISKLKDILKNSVAINSKLNKVIQKLTFLFISKQSDFVENKQILHNIKESNAIIIDYFEEDNKKPDDNSFIFSFKQSLVVIKQSSKSLISFLLSHNPELKLCFLSNIKDNFDKYHEFNYSVISNDQQFQEEISNFSKNFMLCDKSSKKTIISPIWKKICPCICGYLIKQSYSKLGENRFLDFHSNYQVKKDWNEKDYLELRILGFGSIFNVHLIYDIEKERLLALKKPHIIHNETEKLHKREIENYKIINHPLIPKFYGSIDNKQYLFLEYINGQTLSSKKEIKSNDKINIIFELMLIIFYFHDNKFILRDIKPNNIMIDQKNTVVMIDFDRMLKNSDISEIIENKEFTGDLLSEFVDPDATLGNISYKNDIYSLGEMIKYIINKKEPDNNKGESIDYFSKYPKIHQIYIKCVEERPTIDDLFYEFCGNYLSQIDFSKYENNVQVQITLGNIFYFDEYTERDINKTIYYFNLASNQNNSDAQFCLGKIYYEGKYVKFNINKAIYYFSLAADQNDSSAQFCLGEIYYVGEYVECDINKAIHYLLLASNQDDSNAQSYLGEIYYEGKYTTRDIKKAIYYFSLAADNEDLEAQKYLGRIYYDGEFVKQDINKAIYYYSLAADQNDPIAQNILGEIYYTDLHDIKKAIYYFQLVADQNNSDAQHYLGEIYCEDNEETYDINKAIYYLSLASDQNNSDAQLKLGFIYYKKENVKHDINKAIHYFTLASNQNNSYAQYYLGEIYYEGKFVTRDVNKAINYFTFAANHNISNGQYYLGVIYYEGIFTTRDVDKSIYYLKLASDQVNLNALYYLGVIHYEGKYIKRDVDKAINYLTLAANKNHPTAQCCLGIIYFEGKYIKRDINEAIHYFTLAANQNHPDSLFFLGDIYYDRNINKAILYLTIAANQNHADSQYYLSLYYLSKDFCIENINKGLNFLILSYQNGNKYAYFSHGFLYHQGKFIKQDIKEAIILYKEASSFDIKYSKNNLGVIYKNGFGNEISPNIELAIEYFSEAIKQKNDCVSMYNLANIYLYNEKYRNVDKSIELLVLSSAKKFRHASELLSIAMIIKHGFDLVKINNEFDKYTKYEKSSNTISIHEQSFKQYYEYYRNIDYLYDYSCAVIPSQSLIKQELPVYQKCQNITSDFYEGFGFDL